MKPRTTIVVTAVVVLAAAFAYLRRDRDDSVPTAERRTETAHAEAPAPIEQPTSAPTSGDATWEIVALGRGDRPIAGVTVHLRDEVGTRGETGADGRLLFQMPAGSEMCEAIFHGVVSSDGYQSIYGPKAVVHFDNALPLDVRVVDARSGVALPGAKVALYRFEAPAFPLSRDGVVHHLDFSPAAAGEWDSFWASFDVEPPDGFAVFGGSLGFRTDVHVASAAKRGAVTIPVWPAGRVRLRVVDAVGSAVSGAAQISVNPAGSFTWLLSEKVDLDTQGRFTIPSIAVVPGEKLVVNVTSLGRTSASMPVELRAGVSDYDVDVALPEEAVPRQMRCGGSSGIDGTDYSRTELGTASVEIRVLRRDGTPASRALLCIRGRQWAPDRDEGKTNPGWAWRKFVRADENGVAVLQQIPTDEPDGSGPGVYGTVSVELSDPGFVPTEQAIKLVAGARTSSVLREAEGASIELTVVDSAGRPVPWAQVGGKRCGAARRELSDDWAWAALDGDVQDLSPQTGLDGRITIDHLPPGDIEISAEFGGRRARGTFRAGAPATLTLPR